MKTLPYGSWPSPLSAEQVSRGSHRARELRWDSRRLYWLESRPLEKGRQTVMVWGAGSSAREILPAPFDARTRVNEYGGGSYTVHAGTVYFSNFSDGAVYVQAPGAAPETFFAGSDLRFADFVFCADRNRLFAVGEDHAAKHPEPVAFLAALDADGGLQTLARGADFYSSPRVSRCGKFLAWLTWRHPQMPWEGTQLWTGNFTPDGTLDGIRAVAGSETEAVFQPEWDEDGNLYFISDRTGWANLYRADRAGVIEALYPEARDFGQPAWVFGLSTYALLSGGRLLCAPTRDGRRTLELLDTGQGTLRALESSGTDFQSLTTSGDTAAFLSGSFTDSVDVWTWTEARGAQKISSSPPPLPAEAVSIPTGYYVPAGDGSSFHLFYYPPCHPEVRAAEGTMPPLIVIGHGGPTASAACTLSLGVQFWTSRGFAVADVNYRGSTGFGRDFQNRLNGHWGESDVADCTAAARFLVAQGLVDPERLAIRGSSAGGYTTLCALTFHKTFRAGASYYGISDLGALLRDTHKFESRYLLGLIGSEENLRARSPIHFAANLNCPIIFFQGLDDKVVPPNQAEGMVEVLRRKKLPVAYLRFEGEGHGFRRAETQRAALEAELYFYARVFGFALGNPVPPIQIEHGA